MPFKNTLLKTFILILAVSAAATGCKKDTIATPVDTPKQPEKPVMKLDFTTAATSYYLTQPVQFTNTSQNATSYSWDFGDGGLALAASPVHTFIRPGNYKVRLTSGGEFVEKTIVVKNGSASFVVSNKVTMDLEALNCFYWDGSIFNEFKIVANKLAINQTSDTIYTSQARIDMAFKLMGHGFRTVDGFYLTKFGHKTFELTATTMVVDN